MGKKDISLMVCLFLLALLALGGGPVIGQCATEEDELNQTKKEIELLLQEIKGIEKTRSKLESDRDKLRQIMINSNELSAIKILQTIALGCEKYRQAQNFSAYPLHFEDLDNYLAPEIIKATTAESALYGYYYDYDYVSRERFRVKAIPAKEGESGIRTFSIDETGTVIDEETKEPASLTIQAD